MRPLPTTLVGALALLAALIVLPLALAPRAEAFIYWANFSTDSIGRAKLDGSGVNQAFITGASNTGGVAVDAAHIYWTTGATGAIGRAKLDGSGVEQSFIGGAGPLGGVAVDAEHVYWTESSTGTIGRANLDGSGVDRTFITGVSLPRGIAVDAAHVYWTNSGFNTNTIGRANLDGTGVDQSFVEANGPIGLAVDAAHVYWTTNTIGRGNLDGSGVQQSFITIGAGPPVALAVNFSVGKLKNTNDRGIAKLTVEVPAPGGIALAQTKQLKGAEVRAEAAGEVQLSIKPQGRAKKKLDEKGKVKVNAEVTYTPDGGEADAQTTALKLVKRG